MESVEQAFRQAVVDVNQLPQRPSNQSLLNLYGLYKQATDGNVPDDPPNNFDFKAIAKYNAWKALKGTTKEEAMKSYVELVQKLVSAQLS